MKIDLKKITGFTTIDLTIAMIVVLLFVSIMTSLSYNVYLSSTEAKRTAVALNYAVDIFENIGMMNFEEVSASYEILDIASLNNLEYGEITSSNGAEIITAKVGTYDIQLKIENYNEENIIKIITLTITYPVSRKNTETLELQRLKTINV